MSFSTSRAILFGDCDPAGIVYTPRIGYFVVEAVGDYLAHLLGGPGIRKIYQMGILPPARALSIEFLAPMAWDELIDIHVSHQPPGNSSFTFVLEARNAQQQVTFRASFTQVCVDPESKQPVPLPQALREALWVANTADQTKGAMAG